VPGRSLNDSPVLSGKAYECQPERIDWPLTIKISKVRFWGQQMENQGAGPTVGLENP
jgi:hypothetical protein